MAHFTTNLCFNPAMQQGLLGYDSIFGSNVFLDTNYFFLGGNSCRVECPGLKAGEGITCPGGLVPSASSCSASLYIYGKGKVVITAVIGPGNVEQASFPATLTTAWNRIIINDIPCSPGETLFLTVTTATVQSCIFWVSNVQIEPATPAHPYCDGDQLGCFWLDLPFGRSVQQFQFPVTATGSEQAAGNVVPILLPLVFTAQAASTLSHELGDLVFNGITNPTAAFTDFGVWTSADPDPAQTYTSWNTAGANSGTSGAYNRNWSVYYPPLDYIVSDGSFLWKRAAYMALGWQFGTVPHGGTQTITDIQSEVLPITTGFAAPSPSTFFPPRRLHTIVHPDRLNYVPNPSIEISTSGWTAVGSATLAQDGTKSAGNIIEYDDVQHTAGTNSLKITVNASGDGAMITLADLIAGETYVASAYVQADIGLDDITISCANGSGNIISSGIPYGTGEYGDIPFGGEPATLPDITTGIWIRISCIFTAAASTEVLSILSSSGSDVSYPTHFWVDGILAEQGEVVGTYFDGGFGVNYSWETGGTAGLTRSYYYNNMSARAQALLNVLAKHVPLGISYATPRYSIPYTQ